MYSEAELDAAVDAGAISAQSAAALRAFVAQHRAAPSADEEQFRLLTGFNDIFVSIATLLMLLALSWITANAGPLPAAAIVAATAWGLAEFFTRRRRMALPSIVLLVAFVAACFAGFGVLTRMTAGGDNLAMSGGAIGAVVGAWFHWRRFGVPITVAAGALAAVAAVLIGLVALVPGLGDSWLVLLFAAGLALFATAMRWDMSDRARITRRSDVAFWLHLAAAPMIVHPFFALLGLLDSGAGPGRAAIAFALYLLLAAVALVVDRRALLVSALSYVLYAISTLIKASGALDATFALTALVVGSGLLLLSAFWQRSRLILLQRLPEGLRLKMPGA